MTEPTERTITVPTEASVLIFSDEMLEAQIYKPKSEPKADGSHVVPGHTILAAAVAYAVKEDPGLLKPCIDALIAHIKGEGGDMVPVDDKGEPHGRVH